MTNGGQTMKIVIVEDERDLAELLAFNLEKEGFQTVIALDGKSGLERVVSERPDLVILDLMLPEMNGIEVCKMLKQQQTTATIPILMLTAKGEEIDRVVGFEVGADDYLVKPFSARELLLRIKAILRRTTPAARDDKTLRVGTLLIDTARHLVSVSDVEITLTTTEFKLLFTLVERLGRMQSREHLLRHVWGYSHTADTRTVDTHITRLRNKLGDAGELIKTVRGFGYKMEAK
jgi:two-component system, OmpR family, phosphate regulon response regulator PhoB